MLDVRLSEAAAAELDEAFGWYEARESGLGDDLLEEFVRTPDLYQLIEAGVRCAPMQRFPYGVFYRQDQEAIVVIAFFHSRRDPQVWKKRL